MIRLLLVSLALIAAAPAAAPGGALVIVGGGLRADNAAVYRAFIDRIPRDAPAIAIIPVASGEAAGSAGDFVEALVRHGVSRERVRIVRLALIDDPGTPDVDEARWAGHATDRAEIAKITDAGAIWFTGGDQARITAALYAADGTDTPMLAAIRQRLAAGAVIGGTSAGAAIMSRAMIACGDPQTALIEPVGRDGTRCAAKEGGREPLVLARGLGFLPGALVDQHFTERNRIGRLARAIACAPEVGGLGIGIDEGTALVVDFGKSSASVVGKGTVTVLDGRGSRFDCAGFTMSAVRMSRLTHGASIRLDRTIAR